MARRTTSCCCPTPTAPCTGSSTPTLVRFLCDRHAGIGADGVLRVIEGSRQSYVEDGGDWFMDYRNADGSIAEMCGNGIRVFVRYLAEAGLTDDKPVRVGTRAGVKEVVSNDDGTITADMGEPTLPGPGGIVVRGERPPVARPARRHGQPARRGLRRRPDRARLPGRAARPGPRRRRSRDGVNVEFVVPQWSVRRRDARPRARRGGDPLLRHGTCAVTVASTRAAHQSAAGHVPGRRTGW